MRPDLDLLGWKNRWRLSDQESNRDHDPRKFGVLVVDDDHAVLETFSRTLQIAGYQTAVASNVELGLRIVSGAAIHAVILDLHMPFLDGLHFLRTLRTMPGRQTTPVAVVTGDYFTEPATEELIRSMGAALRRKPLWTDDLLILCNRMLTGGVLDESD